ncbi:hypothetical protein TNCV_4718911 [Trichonephila clavipes]|nr:hypothetical protein TNCV_4718911 [Trichonephila clavipes]
MTPEKCQPKPSEWTVDDVIRHVCTVDQNMVTHADLFRKHAKSSTAGTVKTFRKMRSGDLFLEISSLNQATILANLQKLAHLDVTVALHSSLKFLHGVISLADFLNVSSKEKLENMRD